MSNSPLRYTGAAVTQQEVPGEISLTIEVSNCPYRCPGCHSPHLQADEGQPLLPDLDHLLNPYLGQITCVCLMGEGQNPKELSAVLHHVRDLRLRTCLYSGADQMGPIAHALPLLDYLKLGAYCAELGGLAAPTTNQHIFHFHNDEWLDITREMNRKKEPQ